MISLLFPNFSVLSTSEMFLFLFSIIFATAAGVTAFLLVSSGSMKTFRNCFLTVRQLPIVMPDGNILTSKEDLEAHLEVLEKKLVEKASELESSKSKVNDTKDSIEKLASTQMQVKKYYVKLKEEIRRSEDEFKALQEQIDDYRMRRLDLEDNMKDNEVYYQDLLDSVTSGKYVIPDSSSSTMTNTSDDTVKADEEKERDKFENCQTGDSFPKMFEHQCVRITNHSRSNSPMSKKQSELGQTDDKMISGFTETGIAPGAGQKGPTMKPAKCCCGTPGCMGNCNVAKNMRTCYEGHDHAWPNTPPPTVKRATTPTSQKQARTDFDIKNARKMSPRNFKL